MTLPPSCDPPQHTLRRALAPRVEALAGELLAAVAGCGVIGSGGWWMRQLADGARTS